MSDLLSQPIHQLCQLIRTGDCDPRQLLRDLLQRIEQLNPSLNAYVAIDPARLERQLDERLKQGPTGRLFGIPITVKDNLCVSGEETSCGSRILAGFRPPYTATAIQHLIDEGAIIIPRANMDEFAFGSSTESSCHGPTKNPWDRSRVPGGSSGGSAAAVASGMALGALGTDTGGSIRQPASFCGVVGLKPTYGRVSRYGLIAFASSLDQIGPLTQDVTDAALLLSVIAGYDPKDSTSVSPKDGVPTPLDYVKYLRQEGSLRDLRFGIPEEYFVKGIDPEVREAVEQAAKILESCGMRRMPIGLPHTSSAVATYYIVATAEASSNLARYDGVQYGYRAATNGGSLLSMYQRTRGEGFGSEAKRRIILGTYVLSHGYYDAYYLKGLKVRTQIKEDFDRAFERCEVILTPTSPTPAFRIGEKLNDPLQMYLSDIFTISANLAGVPVLSLPCGYTKSKLPIGLQLISRQFDEAILLRVAYHYEQNTGWSTKRPQLT